MSLVDNFLFVFLQNDFVRKHGTLWLDCWNYRFVRAANILVREVSLEKSWA